MIPIPRVNIARKLTERWAAVLNVGDEHEIVISPMSDQSGMAPHLRDAQRRVELVLEVDGARVTYQAKIRSGNAVSLLALVRDKLATLEAAEVAGPFT